MWQSEFGMSESLKKVELFDSLLVSGKKFLSEGTLGLLEITQVIMEETDPEKPLVLREWPTSAMFIKPDVLVMVDMAKSDFNDIPLVIYSRK